ncbi:hypothetical protein SLEP1_g1400 [Rubroshorea leprosula]|uniref:Secreted protein n=1 Tax=Rubroshorea leprosula TaxID=152421 RepID=A0AAV5HIB1_9ROSI|nr:hypothetical protein SLEP1_g1400 [Rubroshorea leprosula]
MATKPSALVHRRLCCCSLTFLSLATKTTNRSSESGLLRDTVSVVALLFFYRTTIRWESNPHHAIPLPFFLTQPPPLSW